MLMILPMNVSSIEEIYNRFSLQEHVKINDFIDLYRQYYKWWFLPLFLGYLPLKTYCDGCHHKDFFPDYMYILSIGWDIIRVSDRSLYISTPKTADQLLPLFTQIPICRYHGPVHDLVDKITNLRCLYLVTVRWDDISPQDYLNLYLKDLTINLLSIDKIWRQSGYPRHYRDDLYDVLRAGLVYEYVTDFMPIEWHYFHLLSSVFPNLKIVRFLVRSDTKILWSQLERYSKIILYRQGDELINIPSSFQQRVEIF